MTGVARLISEIPRSSARMIAYHPAPGDVLPRPEWRTEITERFRPVKRFAHAQTYFWMAALVAGMAAIYLPGLHNALIFDDARLADTVFPGYASIWPPQPRFLAYGSFVWLDSLFGAEIWKQRLFNIGLHLSVCVALWALFRQLLARVEWPVEVSGAEGFVASRNTALVIGILFFAFNPVAVYAVAYLIQRSILGATLGVVLACYLFVRALGENKRLLYVASLLCYLAALACKEHAVMAVTLAFPLYVFIRRPSARQLMLLGGLVAGLLVIAATLLISTRGSIVGKVFDETSLAFIKQLQLLSPDIEHKAYGLSIINQAALFFRYGLLWAIPNPQWMSIDLRPAFPLSFASMHILGLLAFVGTLGAALWLVIRKSGVAGFLGLCLAIPTLLFCSEFATVWIQDPFVLYRSYLWAIAFPGLIVLVLTGLRTAWLIRGGVILFGVLIAIAIARVHSLKDTPTVWSDAIAKLDLQAAENAVGRWRAFNNRGAYYLENHEPERALNDFEQGDALGDTLGSSRFNAGVALWEMKRPKEALASFVLAEKKGFTDSALYFQRGEAHFELYEFEAAFDSYTRALSLGDPAAHKRRNYTKQRLADAALQIRRYDVAATTYQELLSTYPRNYALRLGLAMAHLGQKDFQRAQTLLTQLLSEHPHPGAYYGQAVVLQAGGKLREAIQNLDLAIRLDPKNPGYRQYRDQLAGGTAK